MNTSGAIITAVGGIFTVVIAALVGFLVKRTDRVAKLTQANVMDQAYILKLVSVLRDDYWAAADWMYSARLRFAEAVGRLAAHDEHVESLPIIPTPLHRELERKHAAGEPLDDDDKH